jgi:hypothetical protein
MDGVNVGRLPTSNALLVYNLQNHQFYEPDSYCINSNWLPGSVHLDVKYDVDLFCLLLHDDNSSFEEKYPPGTRVERIEPATNMLLAGTVMDIPFPNSGSGDESTYNYTVCLIMILLPLFLSLRWL